MVRTATSKVYTPQCRNFSVIVENVPALGESITEGEISEWSKAVGEAVAVDDCIAVVETDKVSVEIKSPYSGVLVEQMVELDATITVGAALYKIDTDGEATVTAAAPPVASAPAVSSPTPVAPAPVAKTGARVPLIKFLGKRSLLPKAAPPSPVAAAAAHAHQKVVKNGGGVIFTTLPTGAWHGRPEMSDAEIEAIESGVSPGF